MRVEQVGGDDWAEPYTPCMVGEGDHGKATEGF